MPFRDWLHVIALGGLIASLSVGAAQSQTKPTLKDQPVSDAGQQQRARDGQQAPAAKEQSGPELLPAIKGIEAAIRDYIVKEDEKESERKEKREIDDLKAQQEMALWAERMVWATVASLVLTFAGLAMIGGTLYYTRNAARAAHDAVVAANQTNAIVAHATRIELRAYLSVLPGGINELIGSQLAMGHVNVRNVGKLPAREVSVEVRMLIGDREWAVEESAAKFPVTPDYATKVDRAILPGTEMRQGAAEIDVRPVVDLLQERSRYVFVWGVVYYNDGYKRRHTKFRHRYAIASHIRRDDWDIPADETRSIISVDKARFDPFGNSAN